MKNRIRTDFSRSIPRPLPFLKGRKPLTQKMPNRIQVLNESVINRIAAGEVVERPVSVVKELMENAIDAQATSIQLDIEDGGKKLIRIKDNGLGMGHDDAFLALERHATSKLKSEKDLIGIPTMGFRGEALASIASISRMRLMTKDELEEVGVTIVSEGGALTHSEPVAMKQGTVVEVRNLFYNTPVRRRYLKNSSFESGHIHDLFIKIALANPSIAFTFTDDGKTKVQVPAATSFKERVYGLFPSDVAGNLIELDYKLDGASLFGYVARPPYTRSSMRYIFTFVNSRPVRDRLVNASIIKAFSSLMERGRYPFAIVLIETPPDEVDVNVHPQKAEVRFLKPGLISNLIMNAVNEAILGKPFGDPRPIHDWSRPTPAVTGVSRYISRDGPRQGRDDFDIAEHGPTFSGSPITTEYETLNDSKCHQLSDLSILGRLPNSFIVLYDDDDLVVLDHHAAHERLIFNTLRSSTDQNRRIESQDLLMPQVVELTALEAEALSENLKTLDAAGFVIEDFGSNAFLIRSIPSWLNGTDLDTLFKGFVDIALDTGLKTDPETLRENLFKSMACKAAIKERSKVTTEDIKALISSLDKTDGPSDVCPHGRPILVRIPFTELRRRMGRK